MSDFGPHVCVPFNFLLAAHPVLRHVFSCYVGRPLAKHFASGVVNILRASWLALNSSAGDPTMVKHDKSYSQDYVGMFWCRKLNLKLNSGLSPLAPWSHVRAGENGVTVTISRWLIGVFSPAAPNISVEEKSFGDLISCRALSSSAAVSKNTSVCVQGLYWKHNFSRVGSVFGP